MIYETETGIKIQNINEQKLEKKQNLPSCISKQERNDKEPCKFVIYIEAPWWLYFDKETTGTVLNHPALLSHSSTFLDKKKN